MIVQTPGVYITEKNNLASSVAGVSTAVPAFIGFTEISQSNPIRIKSMFEFENAFGGSYNSSFEIDLSSESLVADKRFFLYETLQLYFKNGGGPCYIISAGNYQGVTNPSQANSALENQITELDRLDEVTIALMPDVHVQFNVGGIQEGLSTPHYGALCSALISKCAQLKDKFAIIDYHSPATTALETRNSIVSTSSDIKYGAVYYPWLVNSTQFDLSTDQLTLNGGSMSVLKDSLTDVNADIMALQLLFGATQTVQQLNNDFNNLKSLVGNPGTTGQFSNVLKYLYGLIVKLDDVSLTDPVISNYKNGLTSNISLIKAIKNLYAFKAKSGYTVGSGWPAVSKPSSVWFNEPGDYYTEYGDVEADGTLLLNYDTNDHTGQTKSKVAMLNDLASNTYVDLSVIFASVAGLFDTASSRKRMIEEQLFRTDQDYIAAGKMVQRYLKQIPSQGAIAGLYCKNDRERGVWKSPANMAVQGIEKPLFEVSNAEQDGLNVDPVSGKSINVIRTFTGKGPLVWGARTLDGNSNEWRYIAVRRFFSFAEESVKKAMEHFVFEPNNARTWVKIKAMVTSFLVEQWKAGALVGSTMDDSFFVNIGETTTTPTDILNGIINVQIGMAVARPAEFIILEFSHQTKA